MPDCLNFFFSDRGAIRNLISVYSIKNSLKENLLLKKSL